MKSLEVEQKVRGRIAAIIPAAGLGERMGEPKALLEMEDLPLVDWLARRLLSAGFSPVVGVLNPTVHAALAGSGRLASDVFWCVNDELDLGPLFSIRLGLGELERRRAEPKAVLIAPVDHPFVSDETLRMLHDAADPDRIVIPVDEGRRGHPPLFGGNLLPLLREVPMEQGARGVYERTPEAVLELEVGDPAVRANLNTPDQWREARRRFAGS